MVHAREKIPVLAIQIILVCVVKFLFVLARLPILRWLAAMAMVHAYEKISASAHQAIVVWNARRLAALVETTLILLFALHMVLAQPPQLVFVLQIMLAMLANM